MSEQLGPRIAKFDNPLGADLIFHSLTSSDHLGRLFQFDFELSSENREIKLENLLGKTMMVCVESAGHQRHFHGYVNRFTTVRSEQRHDVYHASVVPWLWFLTRTSDSRIFQNKTVPDIIKAVCSDNGFTDISDSGLSRTYRTWEYCVQYRETDFNFISRLMEQEGIYYFFKHEAGKHTLVMADSIAAHSTVPGYETVPYFPPGNAEERERDHLSSWSCSKQIMPGSYVVNDYNFETPQADLKAKLISVIPTAKASLEFYDYPDEYTAKGEGDTYVRARMQELEAEHAQFNGSGNVAGLSAGALFSLADYPRKDLNIKYLVVATEYRVGGGNQWEGASTTDAADVRCSIRAIDSTFSYRSPRATPKPVVQGPQTAVVVGPAGEEIYPDKFGRVKVQFFWDRYGTKDENSSCWVRVAHVWAGQQWGGIHIPRIKQEVIVEFLEGDPDRPIITGAVYNNDNMPPYTLPDNMTQSGIKTRSTKGGTAENFNEIRFEDKKDSEHIFMQAQRDMNVAVKHFRDMKIGIGPAVQSGDVTDTTAVTGARMVTISENDTLKITKDHAVTVDGKQDIKVTGDQSESVDGDQSLAVKGKQGIAVTGDQSESVDGDQSLAVKGKQGVTVTGAVAYESKEKIELKVGSNSIVIDQSGITIKGLKVSINADTQAELKGSAMVTVQGGMVKIN